MAERTLNERHQSRLNLVIVTQDTRILITRILIYNCVYSINYKAVTEHKRVYKECFAN